MFYFEPFAKPRYSPFLSHQRVRFWKDTGLSPYIRAIEVFWSLDELPTPRLDLLPSSVSTIQRGQVVLFGSRLARAVFLDWLSAGPRYDQNWDLAKVEPALIPYVLLCDKNYRRKERRQLTKEQRRLVMPDADAAALLLLTGGQDKLPQLAKFQSKWKPEAEGQAFDLLQVPQASVEMAKFGRPGLFDELHVPVVRSLRCDTWLPPETGRVDLRAPVVQVWSLDDAETQVALASSATCFVICFLHDDPDSVATRCREACVQDCCNLVVLTHDPKDGLAFARIIAEKLKASPPTPFQLELHVVDPSKARQLEEIRTAIQEELAPLYLPTQRVQRLAECLARKSGDIAQLDADLQDLVPLLLPTGLVGQIPGETVAYPATQILDAWKNRVPFGLADREDGREESFVFGQAPTALQQRLLRRLFPSPEVSISETLLRVPDAAVFQAQAVLAAPAFRSCAAVPISSTGFALRLDEEFRSAKAPPEPLPFFILVDDRAGQADLAGLSPTRGVCLPAPGRPAQCFLWRPAERDESLWALDPQDLARRFAVDCRAGDSRFLVELMPNPSQKYPKANVLYVTMFGRPLQELKAAPRFLPSFCYAPGTGWSAVGPQLDYSEVPLPREGLAATAPKTGGLSEAEAVELALRRVDEVAARRRLTSEQLLRPKTNQAELRAQLARADNSLTTVAVLVLFLCFALAPVVLLGAAYYWIPVLLLLQELLAILGGLLFVLGDVTVRFSTDAFRERSRRSLQLKSVSSVLLSVCAGLNVAIIAMAFTA